LVPGSSGRIKALTCTSADHRKSLYRPHTHPLTTTILNGKIDPNRNGLLKDIGSINVGFGVGVGIPGNDPVKVGARVRVGFGESGLAGQLPIGQDIYPRQGQFQSLNDYDGDKSNIVPDRARKYWQAVHVSTYKAHQVGEWMRRKESTAPNIFL
uniref:CAP-Gly domain-containing protein n=1 Tax=Haemonchus placei TaxID=6290 RepID=A0A0N4WCF5_HAEPC